MKLGQNPGQTLRWWWNRFRHIIFLEKVGSIISFWYFTKRNRCVLATSDLEPFFISSTDGNSTWGGDVQTSLEGALFRIVSRSSVEYDEPAAISGWWTLALRSHTVPVAHKSPIRITGGHLGSLGWGSTQSDFGMKLAIYAKVPVCTTYTPTTSPGWVMWSQRVHFF